MKKFEYEIVTLIALPLAIAGVLLGIVRLNVETHRLRTRQIEMSESILKVQKMQLESHEALQALMVVHLKHQHNIIIPGYKYEPVFTTTNGNAKIERR